MLLELEALNFADWLPEASKFSVLVNKCWRSMSTNPTPNSTAEKIKKKKVRESKLRLS